MTVPQNTVFQPNPDYTMMEDTVKMVRHCVEGEPAIKRETTTYLKHPNAFDTSSPEQRARYSAYVDGAEFDDYPKTTLASMVGQMVEGEITFDLPERIKYLEQNADGDGMPLAGVVELIYSNLLQVKYHVLVAEYKGLGDVDLDKLSIADLKQANPRASIKQYSRESLIDWDYMRINGVMQLSLMVLVETGYKRDADLNRTEIVSYLVLALDENGDYYQQKFVSSGGVNLPDGGRHYPTVNGGRLKWIPAEIVVDEESPSGSLPRSLGYLYPICSSSLYSYRVSADYKEAMRHIQPTTFTGGWKEDGIEVFAKLNGGRQYIGFGAGVANNLPEGVEVDIKGMGVESEPFEKYFDRNVKKSRSLGARIPSSEETVDTTATQVRSDDRNSNAVMVGIAKNTEAALRRVISYCAMYEGVWTPDSVETNLDSITIDLPKDFGAVAMSTEEVRGVIEAVNAALISRDEGIRKLVAGGFTIADAETIMDELEKQGPPIGSLPPLPGAGQQQPVAQEDE